MSLSGEPIVVLGTFRGGTSCLSTALVAMGLYMGEPDAFQAANEFNKGGFWELEDMQAINAKGLVAFGMTYLGTDRMSEDWRERPGSEIFVSELRAILHRHFEDKQVWGWKEPATTSLFPLYKAVLTEEGLTARYPIMVRHPLSVAASRKRQFEIKNTDATGRVQGLLPPDEQRALGMWVDYMLTNLREAKGSPRYVISYEDLLENPAQQLKGLAEGLLPWKPSTEQMQAGVDTINPEWSHSRFSLDDLKGWPTIVERTYDVCLRAAADPSGLNAGKFDGEIDALWDEWLTTSNMVRSTQMPPGHMLFSWREGDALKHNDHAFTPTGGWQTIRSTVTGLPGETVQITPYQMACQVWIKKAIWHVSGQEIGAPLMAGPNGILEKPGLLRLTSLGSGSVATRVPDGDGPAELELEFLLQFDISSLNAVAMTLKARLDAARRGAPQGAR